MWKRPQAALERRVSDLLHRQDDGNATGTDGVPSKHKERDGSLETGEKGDDTVRPAGAKGTPIVSVGQGGDTGDGGKLGHTKGKDSKSDCLIM